MAIKIATCNQKGGVAKTATIHQLAAYLVRQGKKVLLVDIDPQYNLSTCIGAPVPEMEEAEVTIYHVLRGDTPIKHAITYLDRYALLGSTTLLSKGANGEFSGGKAPYMLRKAISEVEDEFDYVLIDTPPTLGLLAAMGLTAADGVIIPYKADALTIAGVKQMEEAINEVREYFNPNLKIYGILVTMFDNRTNVSKRSVLTAKEVAERLGTRIFNSKIRYCSAMRELPDSQTDIFEYDPKCIAAEDYGAFGAEMMSEVQNG